MTRPRRGRLLLAVGCAVLAAAAAGVWKTHVFREARPPRPEPSAHVRSKPSTRGAARRYRRSIAAVPVLMYHVIGNPPSSAPFPGLYVPAGEFAAQMHALARAGYRAVTLDQLRAGWEGKGPLPRMPIALTFDNGYRTQYTQALPVLRRLHWVAGENIQLTGLPPRQGGLSEREVRALIAAGWELDTQGYNHADLARLDQAQLRFQVAATRHTLQRRYHVPVDWFCYPSGDYDPKVIAAVKAAGYVGSTTVVPGWAKPRDDPYALPRLRVLRGTTPQELLDLIAGTRTDPAPPDASSG